MAPPSHPEHLAASPAATTTLTTSSSFSRWTARLQQQGFGVLANSHAVPVELWLREQPGTVLLFRARGTRVTLRRYSADSLTGLILRSECDCAAHREAGAARRTTLSPGAVPLDEVVYDGADALGWVGHQAGLLDVASAELLFHRLLAELAGRAAADPATEVTAVTEVTAATPATGATAATGATTAGRAVA